MPDRPLNQVVEPQSIQNPNLRKLSSFNSFAVSFVLHLGILIGLAIIVIPSLQRDGFDLSASPSLDRAEFELEMPDLSEMTPTLVSKSDETITASSVSVVEPIDVQEITINDRVLAWQQDAAVAGAKAQAVSASKSSKKGLEVTGASFYGIEAKGDKFVFIVDSSTSMDGLRWNNARQELVKSIEALGPDQRFFAICFDIDARPLFGNAPPKNKYLLPSTNNVTRVRSWLKQIDLRGSTQPANALAMAISMEPDAIYLLSDGEIRDQSQLLLQRINRDDEGKILVPIHTISLFSTEGRYTLMQIANQNGGTFRSIDQKLR